METLPSAAEANEPPAEGVALIDPSISADGIHAEQASFEFPPVDISEGLTGIERGDESTEQLEKVEDPEEIVGTTRVLLDAPVVGLAALIDTQVTDEGDGSVFGDVDNEQLSFDFDAVTEQVEAPSVEQKLDHGLDQFYEFDDEGVVKVKPLVVRSGDDVHEAWRKRNKETTEHIDAMSEEDLHHVVTGSEYEALWSARDFQKQMARVYIKSAFEADGDQSKISETAKEALRRIFTHFGFDLKTEVPDIRSAWGAYEGSKDRLQNWKEKVRNIRDNLYAMINLESAKEGLPARLYRTAGIRNFGRYNHYDLVNMFNREHLKVPPVVLLTAAEDWNGAFTGNFKNQKKIKAIDDERGKVYIEARSPYEAARRLITVSRALGPIDHLIVQAHGNKGGLLLGKRGKDRTPVFKQKDVEASKGLKRIVHKRILAPKARITIASCEVGKEGGFAESVADQTGLKVVAPHELFSGYSGKKTLFRRRPKFQNDGKEKAAKVYR